jgi:hypothetical protein
MLILKGEGVEYDDPEAGPMRVHFPAEDNPHRTEHSHFHLHPRTGEPIEGIMGRWPLEGAVYRQAVIQFKRGRFSSLEAAVSAMRKAFNRAALNFNQKMMKIDPHHRYPYPVFMEDGSLNPELKTNHYSRYFGGPDTPMHERPVRDKEGRVFTATINNAPHPRHGLFPEVPTLPFFKQLQEEFQKMGIQTSMGRYPYLKPDHFLVDENGNSRHKRHPQIQSSDPMAPNTTGQDLGNVSLASVFELLPSDFFTTKEEKRGQKGDAYKEMLVQQTGIPRDIINRMTATVAGALLHPDRNPFNNSTNRFTKRMREIQQQLGIAPTQEGRMELDALKRRFASDPNWRGGRKSHSAAAEAIATMILARQSGMKVDTGMGAADNPIRAGFERFSRAMGGDSARPYDVNRPIPPSLAPEPRTQVTDMRTHAPHISYNEPAAIQLPVGSFVPEPVVDTTVEAPPPQMPMPMPGQALPPQPQQPMGTVGVAPRAPVPRAPVPRAPRPSSFLFRRGADSLYDIMERIQMAEAEMDGILLKSDNVDNLAQNYNLSEQDILAIRHGVGNWETLAKALSIPYDVVRAVKVASR